MRNTAEKLHIVNNFIDRFDAPIQTVSLANELGINVYHADWPDNISGKIQKDTTYGGSSGFAIFVNKGHPITRRRFTTAHEIAHYVLHEEKIGDGIFDDALYRSGLSNQIEAEANGLAANILVPWSILNKYIPKYSNANGVDIKKLAEIFDVSHQSMAIRLGQPY